MIIKSIKKGNLEAVIRELTVGDMLNIVSSLPLIFEVDDDYIIENKLTIIELSNKFITCNKPLIKLNLTEISFLFENFKQVNSILFKSTKKLTKKIPVKPSKQTESQIRHDLDNMYKSISNMIENGHINILEYAWSFYISISKTKKGR